MIKAIIFDYGGVVAGTKSESSGIYDLCRKFSSLMSLPISRVYFEYHKYWNRWKLGKLTMNQVYTLFLKDIGSTYPKRELMNLTLNHSALNKQVYKMIKKLKKSYKIVCLTNHTREWFGYDAKRFKLNKIFHKIYTSYNLKMSKPHPEIYLYVLKDLKLNQEECLFIDDLKRNVDAAREIGMHVIHFKSYSQLKKEIPKLGIDI
jgi:epoxide hydrolase-like predicted phosphatase